MADKMEVLTLLLVFLTVSGYSYVLQPRLTVTEVAELDRDQSDQLKDLSISVKDKENAGKSTETRKTEDEEHWSEGLTPEANLENEERMRLETLSKILSKETKGEEFPEAVINSDTDEEVERREDRLNLFTKSESVRAILAGNTKTRGKSHQLDKLEQEIMEEERQSKLVAGIHLHEEIRGETVNPENVAEEGGHGEKEAHVVVSDLTPLSTSSTQLREESVIPATTQIITQPQKPPSSPPPVHHHNAPLSSTQVPLVSSMTSYHKVSPHLLLPSVTPPSPTTINFMSTVLPGEVRSIFLLEDLLTEVLQNPILKQNELEVKASPNLEDVMVKNIFKPARKEPQTIVVQPKEAEFITEVQVATPKAKAAKFISKVVKEFQAKSSKPNMTQPTGETRPVNLMENDTKPTETQNKSPPPHPQVTKPAARPRLTTAKTPSTRPMKNNRSSKNKTIKKSKEKKRKKDNKTQKPSEKKKVITPTHFPYFKDNYCPPECACYGRVVQCSDKGVNKVPYGIPYNARYILLMNNHIDMIQLDLLSEYVSMEFLVLSNNLLTDGAIEGAFEGIPALKRLYLDRNLLNSVPTDLPHSLEELRLDNNGVSVMSEAAWARCPGLLVLSLSNNSLGNGSESLPDAVLTPLSNLRTLNLDHNQLTSVPLGLPLSIKELYLKGNLIEQFRSGAFNGISELVVLDLSANQITNKGLLKESLLNTTHLESLNLEGNRLKQVPRHLPRSLKTLNLDSNLISSIKKAAFGTLKNLEHLGLARNKIFKVAPGAFKTMPVLHQLDLCHNILHQVPRQLPEALHLVALTHNKIQSVPRDSFCWGNKSTNLSRLVRVQLEQNLIDMGRLDAQAFRCLRGFQVVHFY